MQCILTQKHVSHEIVSLSEADQALRHQVTNLHQTTLLTAQDMVENTHFTLLKQKEILKK
jgi:hypothetical protein